MLKIKETIEYFLTEKNIEPSMIYFMTESCINLYQKLSTEIHLNSYYDNSIVNFTTIPDLNKIFFKNIGDYFKQEKKKNV